MSINVIKLIYVGKNYALDYNNYITSQISDSAKKQSFLSDKYIFFDFSIYLDCINVGFTLAWHRHFQSHKIAFCLHCSVEMI